MLSKAEQIRKAAANVNTLFIGAVDDQWQMFSDDPDNYSIGLPIGFGASSIVYAAHYTPADGSPSLPCAVKIVDLDKLPPQSLRLLRRETQLMSLSKHPHVLRVRGSWITGHKLYIALRLMNSGSAADIMHYGWPGGMEEEVVKCILKQALEGLSYLHINGFIHRDIKAANLLIDDDGTVLLGDLGVAASLSDDEPTPVPSGSGPKMNFNSSAGSDPSGLSTTGSSSRKLGKRKSFVGTPCWMAPELISGKQYDAKADIWSFGITAIELTQGRAPRSREAPARVLLKTVQEEPPLFARESGANKFSKAFKDIVESCLAKDPSRRPSAAELLESPFFKSAKKKGYLVGAILKDLPPLVKRQERQALSSNRSNAQGHNSVSSWDFTIELPRTPLTSAHPHPRSPLSNSAHPSYFSTVHSQHSQHSHHSHHHTLTLPNTSRLDALDENAFADVLSRLKDTRPSLPEPQNVEDMATSPDSSVFDLSESSHASPDVASSSLPGSSTNTTPLSCSPATALSISDHRKGSKIDPPIKNASKETHEFEHRQTYSTSNGGLAQKRTDRAQARRSSSPGSERPRPGFSSFPTLKRVTSASGWTAVKASISPSSPSSPAGTSDADGDAGASASVATATSEKGGRWRKFIRSNSSPKIGDDGSNAKEGERKRSTLVRILERTGK